MLTTRLGPSKKERVVSEAHDEPAAHTFLVGYSNPSQKYWLIIQPFKILRKIKTFLNNQPDCMINRQQDAMTTDNHKCTSVSSRVNSQWRTSTAYSSHVHRVTYSLLAIVGGYTHLMSLIWLHSCKNTLALIKYLHFLRSCAYPQLSRGNAPIEDHSY